MTDASLGRINVFSVPLPHNGTSLKARISQAEKVLGDDVKLFKDDSGEVSLNDNDVVDFLSDTYPGVVADDPVAIVYETSNGFSKRLRATQDSSARPSTMFYASLIVAIFQPWEIMIRRGTRRERGRFSKQMEY